MTILIRREAADRGARARGRWAELDDPPESLAELRGVLLREHE